MNHSEFQSIFFIAIFFLPSYSQNPASILHYAEVKCTIQLMRDTNTSTDSSKPDAFLTFLPEPRPVARTTLRDALRLRRATAGLDEDLGRSTTCEEHRQALACPRWKSLLPPAAHCSLVSPRTSCRQRRRSWATALVSLREGGSQDAVIILLHEMHVSCVPLE